MSLDFSNRSDPKDYFEILAPINARYQSPVSPLGVQMGPRSGGVAIPDDELEVLSDYASWTNAPQFDSPGRSGYVKRNAPLRAGDTSIYGYKLKGIGNFNGKTRTITPPKSDSYQPVMGTRDNAGNISDELPVILIHMGIAENGTLYPVLDPPKPVGGLSSGRGQREFSNAAKLYKAGVPACLPIAWGRYPELQWQGQPIEFVILGMPSDINERLGAYFEPDTSNGRFEVGQEMRSLIASRFDVYDPRNPGEPLIRIASDMGRNIGGLLRSAHEAGVARFASHTGNFSLMPNKRGLLLHDLDSSVELDSLSPQARALTMTRDIESAIFGFTHSLTHANVYWIVNNPERFLKFNPIKALLKGYFRDDVDEVEIDRASGRIVDMVIQLIKVRTERPSVNDQSMWMAYATANLVPLCLSEVFRLYEKSALNQQNKLPYGSAEFEVHFQRFTRQSEEMFMRRHAEIMAQRR
ncbi:MAG: hypothetical protein NTX63_04975 [Candidatus Peregrinibacteria bacterium]|nr:hypothetical protein [Candidatus Peregrinibacteria bacterium]